MIFGNANIFVLSGYPGKGKSVFIRGWEFGGTHQPLTIVEKPDPKAKPGYVVLKTLAGGLCHSDVSALDIESWMASFNVPVIMGHEICGEIVEIGEGIEKLRNGEVSGRLVCLYD